MGLSLPFSVMTGNASCRCARLAVGVSWGRSPRSRRLPERRRAWGEGESRGMRDESSGDSCPGGLPPFVCAAGIIGRPQPCRAILSPASSASRPPALLPRAAPARCSRALLPRALQHTISYYYFMYSRHISF